MTNPRAWATGGSRDEMIDGSPQRGHVARHSATPLHAFKCAKCGAQVDDCELFCALHLWTFDNPVLRDAPILFDTPEYQSIVST
jgi:hypothetical protein